MAFHRPGHLVSELRRSFCTFILTEMLPTKSTKFVLNVSGVLRCHNYPAICNRIQLKDHSKKCSRSLIRRGPGNHPPPVYLIESDIIQGELDVSLICFSQ